MGSQPAQLDMFPGSAVLSSEAFQARVREEILKILSGRKQPGAGELLWILDDLFGWRVRQAFLALVQRLRTDTTIQAYLRQYLTVTLSDQEVESALRGEAKPGQDFKSTVDDLFRKSVLYRTTDAFKEAIEFTAKFRDYAPYNNMLVKIQNPSCSFYATEKDWEGRFKRRVTEDARPMLILAPMHPVMLVFDLDSTEGPPLPDKFETFARAEGEWNPEILKRTIENTERDRILVQFKPLSSTHGGFATTRLRDGQFKMRIVVHNELDGKSRYAVLCHELAHIYLGHLGSDRDGWWPSRINLTNATVEIEAEAVAYIVALRAGLRSHSEEYLSSYLKDASVPESVSLELIAKVAGKLEEMGKHKQPPRKGASPRSRQVQESS